MEGVFLKIKNIVEKELACSAHSMDHVMRVFSMCERLAKEENVDMDVINASALLHDIARIKEDNDPSGKINHAVLGAEMAEDILLKLNFDKGKIEHVKRCIRSHRYRENLKPESLEAKILHDADRLDALGAIGIGRIFVWTGRNQANFFKKVDLDKYKFENLTEGRNGRIKDKTKHNPWIEYEMKLKNIKNLLFLEKSKKIAIERDKYMREFFDRLEKESKGEI